ncbi:MAG: endonuclease/exonuclease/phosphatase family protein [Treponema sp.]|nr:endonuclease/exonuclease/phosphatase family protein [Treponema sp.]
MKRNYVHQNSVHGLLCAVVLLALAVGCAGCNQPGTEEKAPVKSDSIAIMTWNVQALFDGVDEGTEYDDYRESTGWTPEKYRGRLNVIAGAIGGMGRKPDIIALQEIESALVTTDLAAALSAQGYGWTHFANIPGMSLGVGLLSRYPLTGAKSHSVNIDGDIAPRPMLEVRINTAAHAAGDETGAGGSSLALFICHWKSKLGSEDATERTRRASARIILRRLRELMETDPDLPVIIMGDLNENHDEFYRRSGTAISALLPDDLRAAEFTGLYGLDDDDPNIAAIIGERQKDFIILSKSKPPATRYFPAGVLTLYSPWAAELQDGSYYYKNDWETIDHFLLSPQLFNESGWGFESCEVVNSPPFVSAKGFPVAYNPRTGSGMSDHLPLLLLLKKYGQ